VPHGSNQQKHYPSKEIMDPTDMKFTALAINRAWKETMLDRDGNRKESPFRDTRQEMQYVRKLELELAALGYKITKE